MERFASGYPHDGGRIHFGGTSPWHAGLLATPIEVQSKGLLLGGSSCCCLSVHENLLAMV